MGNSILSGIMSKSRKEGSPPSGLGCTLRGGVGAESGF